MTNLTESCKSSIMVLYGTNVVGQYNPIRYRGYYYDTDTGFYYLQSRYYDPAIKRFINADSYVNANGDILGFNMYAYCGNNPINMVDYNGEDPVTFALAAKGLFALGVLIVGVFVITVVTSPDYQEFVSSAYSEMANTITYASEAIREKVENASKNKSKDYTVYLLKDSGGNVQYVGRTINPKKEPMPMHLILIEHRLKWKSLLLA